MDEKYKVVTVDGATKLYFELKDTEKLIKAYETGIHNRTMRETFVNETSSRSHMIFAVMIEMTSIDETKCSVGKLTCIDLAGSESLAEIGVNPTRFIEGI